MCRDYINNNMVATIEIRNLVQPNFEKETDSVTIEIRDKSNSAIARVDKGVTFTPLRGELTATSSALVRTVQE